MLNAYLDSHNKRHTRERIAILDTLCENKGWLTKDEIATQLTDKQFTVSNATLYNTLKLLTELRIVNTHRFNTTTRYAAALTNTPKIVRICTVCGKAKDIRSKPVVKAVEALNITRFTQEGFSLCIYGVCSACKAKITKKELREQARS